MVTDTLVVSDADRDKLEEFDKLSVDDSEGVTDFVIEACCDKLSE